MTRTTGTSEYNDSVNSMIGHYSAITMGFYLLASPLHLFAEVATDSLKGRVFELSLADLNAAEDLDYRKIKLIGEEVQGKALLTSFYGMDMTRDKMCSLIRKWQTLIEASAEVKTTDGYVLRMFCIAFTKRRPNQVRKTSYAQSSQIRAIRKKMEDIMAAGERMMGSFPWCCAPLNRLLNPSSLQRHPSPTLRDS